MRTILLILGIIIVLIALIGADFRKSRESTAIKTQKRSCQGYTIIEFGKGIDCNGDTVRLVRVPGGQQLASQ